MVGFLQWTFSGVLIGLLYALIALGLVVVWRSGRIVNLAQGEIVVFGGFVIGTFTLLFSQVWWIGLLISFGLLALVGVLVERGIFRPIVGQPLLSLFMVTIALILVFRGITLVTWGGEPRSFPTIFPAGNVNLGPFGFDAALFWGGIVSLLLVVALTFFFERTKWGLRLSAVAEDHQVAEALGISVTTAIMLAWIIAALLGGFASIVFLNGKTLTFMASMIGFRGVAVAILAGLESVKGVLLAGIIVGICESWARGYIDPYTGGGMSEILPFLIMIGVIIWRPQGLFGWRIIERV